MNIAGVIVHSKPQTTESVKGQLVELPGVEVHAVTDDGRLVVTVEEDEENILSDVITRLHDLEGVLSAAMVYHHSECEPSEQEASQ